jgi:hypothetical protein
MKPKQKSGDQTVAPGSAPIREPNAAFSTPVRTGEAITKAGLWRSECSREGCRAVEHLHLYRAAPAPPCVCGSPTTLHFVRAPIAEEMSVGTVKGPQLQPAPPAAIGLPTESVHSARGAAASEASVPIPPEPPPEAAAPAPPPAAAADPAEQEKTEAPPIAEPAPSLFQKLRGKSSRKTT